MIPISHKCPVCKARLWKTVFSGKLRCPRCGAEFRPTVPLLYFQVLFILFILLCLLVVIDWSSRFFWPIVLFGVLLIFFSSFLPRIVRMEIDPTNIPVAEGPNSEDFRYKMQYDDWDEQEAGAGPGMFLAVLCILLGLLTFLIIIRFFT